MTAPVLLPVLLPVTTGREPVLRRLGAALLRRARLQ